MELWIRSQDRESLCAINGIAVDGNTIITVSLTLKNIFTLGTYKSKERALEILDEIMGLLIITEKGQNILVYEMPKE